MLAPSQKFPGIPRRVVTTAFFGWLALAALLAPLGCSGPPSSPSFLILSIDTLRADHLGSYGYSRETSPNLDRFANRSVRFENAFAPAPWTLPATTITARTDFSAKNPIPLTRIRHFV